MVINPNIRNLSIELELFGLMVTFHFFRWAAFAFKTKDNVLGKRSTQLFAGPLHIWKFQRVNELTISISIGFAGGMHGRYKPDGEDAIPYFWKWLTQGETTNDRD